MLRDSLVTVVCLWLTGWAIPVTAHGQTPPNNQPEPKAIAPEVVKAWEKAGAKLGWMKVDCFGHRIERRFDGFTEYSKRMKPQSGEVPAFRVPWKKGFFAALPQPGCRSGSASRAATSLPKWS
jgi:hypothetical protein